MRNGKIEQWIVAFKKVAADHLDKRNHRAAPEAPLVDIKECTSDKNCLTVTVGEIMQHVAWSESDPSEAAEALLQKMLPPPMNPTENNGSEIPISETETDPAQTLAAADPTFQDLDEKVILQHVS